MVDNNIIKLDQCVDPSFKDNRLNRSGRVLNSQQSLNLSLLLLCPKSLTLSIHPPLMWYGSIDGGRSHVAVASKVEGCPGQFMVSQYDTIINSIICFLPLFPPSLPYLVYCLPCAWFDERSIPIIVEITAKQLALLFTSISQDTIKHHRLVFDVGGGRKTQSFNIITL